jgi:hypothetical protein
LAQAQTSHSGIPGQISWTRDLARDLFPGRATPFGWTLLRAPAENAMRDAWAALSATELPTAPFWEAGIDGYVRLNASNLAATGRALYGAAWLGRSAARPRPASHRVCECPASFGEPRPRFSLCRPPCPFSTRLFDWYHWVRALKWIRPISCR